MNKSCTSDEAIPFLSETQKNLVNELWEFYITPLLDKIMKDDIYTGCYILLKILNNKDKACIQALAGEYYAQKAADALQNIHRSVWNEIPNDDPWFVAVLDVRLGHNPKFIEEERREIAQMIHDYIYQWLLSKFPKKIKEVEEEIESENRKEGEENDI
jgi:hypothetical protein